MIRWFFKWMFRLAFAVIALAIIVTVAILLSYNSILRAAIQHRIQSQTGMDAQIGSFKLALASPTLRMQDIKIANPPDFGGAPFLNISEIYVDYDRAALAKKEIHIKLLRFNLAELDIVKNASGRTNIFAFAKPLSPQKNKSAAPAAFDFKKQTGYNFTGIDELNVSVGKLKYLDLANPQNDREQTIGLESCVIPHVKSAADLAGLVLLIDLRSNHFFDPFIQRKGENSAASQLLLDMLGVTF